LIPVKYGSDAEIAAVWSEFEEVNPGWNPKQLRNFVGITRNMTALYLLRERDFRGERLAFDLAEYHSVLPDPWRNK
jgi:hypothetical protein